jgi:uncharacterized protein YecE (DUF72 family)
MALTLLPACLKAANNPYNQQVPSLFAGTSGFAYPTWKPDFYPAKLPAKKFLEYYSTRLNCVEINYTFRALPALSTLTNWVEATPETFLFCPKAHMRLTHILKLKDAGTFTEVFLKAIDPLRCTRRLGPVLFQLPPTLKCDSKLLAGYLAILPPEMRFAFEFRHASWLNDEVYDLLRKHNVALCLAESEDLKVPEIVTADFVYFRLRNPEYSPEDRNLIAENARRLLDGGRDLFLFFKHEDTPQGAVYAEEVLSQCQSPR